MFIKLFAFESFDQYNNNEKEKAEECKELCLEASKKTIEREREKMHKQRNDGI